MSVTQNCRNQQLGLCTTQLSSCPSISSVHRKCKSASDVSDTHIETAIEQLGKFKSLSDKQTHVKFNKNLLGAAMCQLCV